MITPLTRSVRCLENPTGALHPEGERPLVPGDVIEPCDAMNGNVYWYDRRLPCMQSLPMRCFEAVSGTPAIEWMRSLARAFAGGR
jgi:hypothetical protein